MSQENNNNFANISNLVITLSSLSIFLELNKPPENSPKLFYRWKKENEQKYPPFPSCVESSINSLLSELIKYKSRELINYNLLKLVNYNLLKLIKDKLLELINDKLLKLIKYNRESWYCRRTVTKEFYDLVIKLYPALAKSTREAIFAKHLFLWLIYGKKDKDTGKPILSEEKINYCGEQAGLKLSSAEEGLKIYQEFFPEFTWSNWSYTKRKARVCDNFGITEPELLLAIEKELTTNPKSGGRIWFVSGKTFTKENARLTKASENQFKKRWAEWQAKVDKVEPYTPEQREVQDYLNNHAPGKLLNRIHKNYDKAWEKAQEITNASSRIHNLNLLTVIYESLPIFTLHEKGIQYRCTENSMRLFSVGETILGLSKDIRKTLCPDWIDLDLVSAQTAICAAVWDVPEVIKFLEEGKSIWEYLIEHMKQVLEKLMDREIDEQSLKKLLKKMWYAILFGATIPSSKRLGKSRNNNNSNNNDAQYEYSIVETIEEWWSNQTSNSLDKKQLTKILNAYRKIDLVKIMLRKRDVRLKQLKQHDQTYKLVDINGVTWTKSKAEGYTLLPIEAQSYEFYIMYHGVFNYLKSCDEATIELWQHDGCTIYIDDKSSLESLIDNINKNVNKVLDDLYKQGIIKHRIITKIVAEELK